MRSSSVLLAKAVVHGICLKWSLSLSVTGVALQSNSVLLGWCQTRISNSQIELAELQERCATFVLRYDEAVAQNCLDEAIVAQLRREGKVLAGDIRAFSTYSQELGLFVAWQIASFITRQLKRTDEDIQSLKAILRCGEQRYFHRDLILWLFWTGQGFDDAIGDVKERALDLERLFASDRASSYYSRQVAKLIVRNTWKLVARVAFLVRAYLFLHHRNLL